MRQEVSTAMQREIRDDPADCHVLLAWIRTYANTRINSLLIDTRRSIPPHIVLDFGNAGLMGLQAPRTLGGLGLSNRSLVRVLEQLAAVDLNLATFLVVHNCLGIGPLLSGAAEPLRSDAVSAMATGRVLGAFALTEPSAGSNPNALEGRVMVGGDGKTRLSAQKMWIGSAGWAGYISVFARRLDANGKPSGTSGYVVPTNAKGVRLGPELLTMGMRGMVQNMVEFKGVLVSESHCLGEPGNGFAVAHGAMMQTRLALGALAVGAMKRCLQLMTRYAQRRTGICSGQLISTPVSRVRLTALIAQIGALERLVEYTAERLDCGKKIPDELFVVAKVVGSEFLWQTADWCVQMLGGRGYLESNVVTQIMRDARVGRIFEGPTEALLHHIGSRLLMEPEPLQHFFASEVGATDVGRQLLEVSDVVRGREAINGARFPGRQARDYSNYVLGCLVAKAVLAAISRATVPDGNAKDPIAHWAADELRKATAELLSSSPEFEVRTEGDILEMVDGYRQRIGDIEQTLPGEEWRLDPYLKRLRPESYDLAW